MAKIKNRWGDQGLVGVLIASVALVAGVGVAHATFLSYPTNEIIYLSTPQVTLTIQAGSAADNLTVNATSVAVILSNSMGGTFVLTSPQALSSSTVGSGGTLSQTCSSGVETDTIIQASGSETYTLTPSGSACVQPSQGGGDNSTTTAPSSGPSVSVSSAYGSPYLPGESSAASSTITPTSSLVAELKSLEAQLAALQAQANQTASSTTHFTFTRNLSLGMTGNDVTKLQQFLISENGGPAARKLATHGTTAYFGSLTKAALIEFQQHVGIKPASGFFGPITRAWVNGLAQDQ